VTSATSLLGRVADLVGDAPTVTLVVGTGPVDATPLDRPGREVRVQVHDRDAVALHDALSGLGHVDAVVDLARGRGVVHRVAMLATHVRCGGLLVLAVPPRPGPRAALHDLVAEVAAVREAGVDPPARRPDPRPYAERDRHALATALAPVLVDDELVVLRVEVATWSVVPEARVDDLLRAAPRLGEVLATRPGDDSPAAATTASSWPDEPALPTHGATPLSLRSYADAVVAPWCVAHVRDLVLPQAFRNTARTRPTTPALTDWNRWSVRVPGELGDEAPEPDRLPGTWFHADNVMRGHFGHALTEQLSHLWAWPEVLERHPDVGVLVTTDRSPVAGWELELLEAAGVPRDRVHGAPRPVRVDRLLAATPGYVIGQHVHPSLRATYAAVGDALEARSGLTTTPARLFVTRSHPKRRCHEAAEVEALAVAHGFTVVAPEEHPLPDQVAMARRAEAVAGWAGSGMFHQLLGGPPRPMVVLAHTAYHAWNEKAAAALWGHPLTIVRGTPDDPSAAPGRFASEVMHSDFHLDLDGAAGRLLREALAGLG
jgi:capsular polysaccharide biosynthesis protein